MSYLFIKIYYGPSHSFDRLIYKPHLLTGIKDRLQKLGFRVDLVPVKYDNYCMIEMCGHEVFRCNIRNLKFNTCHERDPVARRALEAIMTSAVKLRQGRACLWFWTLLNDQMFRRTKYQPKDYWPIDVDLTSLATVTECMKCCDMLIKEEPKKEERKPETYFKL